MPEAANYSRRSGPGNRQLRVGDTERDAVSDILRREHLAGRFDNDEFDERLARCLAAKTYAELDELISDFPADEREPQRDAWRDVRAWRRPWPLLLLPLLALAIVFSHGRAAWLLLPFFFWFVVRPFFWRGFGWGCWSYGTHRF
jgi:Domain of unknown function (DUF1707)